MCRFGTFNEHKNYYHILGGKDKITNMNSNNKPAKIKKKSRYCGLVLSTFGVALYRGTHSRYLPIVVGTSFS